MPFTPRAPISMHVAQKNNVKTYSHNKQASERPNQARVKSTSKAHTHTHPLSNSSPSPHLNSAHAQAAPPSCQQLHADILNGDSQMHGMRGKTYDTSHESHRMQAWHVALLPQRRADCNNAHTRRNSADNHAIHRQPFAHTCVKKHMAWRQQTVASQQHATSAVLLHKHTRAHSMNGKRQVKA